MKKIVLLVFLILPFVGKVFSQTDTLIIIKTDTVFVPEKKDIMYKLFLEKKEAELKHLWKLNFVDFGLLKPNIGFEQRLYKSLNIEGYVSLGYQNSNYYMYSLDFNEKSFQFEQLFKYYFDTKIRKRKGLRTDGFSGFYMATSIKFDWHEYGNSGSYGPISKTNLNFGLKYGYQTRIASFISIDLFAGFDYAKSWDKFSWVYGTANSTSLTGIYPYAGIRAGFAIGSFKNLKSKINH